MAKADAYEQSSCAKPVKSGIVSESSVSFGHQSFRKNDDYNPYKIERETEIGMK
ncbi:hypothetical protein RLOatenuis_4750 [Rickettsiales bacterium]|nr:hypothetical protein RLOatenuis_4750 [Rickettsiales bacterium]